jgi:hypothetical protein
MVTAKIESLYQNRAHLGCKPVAALPERLAEARRLTGLLKSKDGFSFIRVGDNDLAYLWNAEDGGKADLFPDGNAVFGTRPLGGPGLDATQAPRLRSALINADYLDFHECLWKDEAILDDLKLQRAQGTTCNPDRATSYILPTWLESEFKSFCNERRVLFCGAEVPLLEELLKHSEFRRVAANYWPESRSIFFLRPREDGRNLGRNLDLIKQDLVEFIRYWRIDTLFLSLGGGAKIVCYELARELGICGIDFGSFIRSFTYSGSQGNRVGRATHLIFIYQVPFNLYMDALEKTFPDLTPEALLAKAHAQLLLEVQEKEVGWSHAAWEYDFSPVNVEYFKESFSEYKRRYGHLFSRSAVTRKERADFLHFCGTHGLTWEGRVFMIQFKAKGWARKILERLTP